MRLLILGPTGGSGRQLTSQAVEHGYRVTAFVRSPQKLGSLPALCVSAYWSVKVTHAALPICGRCFPVTTP